MSTLMLSVFKENHDGKILGKTISTPDCPAVYVIVGDHPGGVSVISLSNPCDDLGHSYSLSDDNEIIEVADLGISQSLLDQRWQAIKNRFPQITAV